MRPRSFRPTQGLGLKAVADSGSGGVREGAGRRVLGIRGFNMEACHMNRLRLI